METRDEIAREKHEMERLKAEAMARIEMELGPNIDDLQARLDEDEGRIRLEVKKAGRSSSGRCTPSVPSRG